jgi:hypothetical protein
LHVTRTNPILHLLDVSLQSRYNRVSKEVSCGVAFQIGIYVTYGIMGTTLGVCTTLGVRYLPGVELLVNIQ